MNPDTKDILVLLITTGGTVIVAVVKRPWGRERHYPSPELEQHSEQLERLEEHPERPIRPKRHGG
jgi:hypothetical protein